jgi:hypothetical protein
VSKLGGAPSLAHAAEADAVGEGRSESVEDDAEQVLREVGPRTAVAPGSFLGRWHDEYGIIAAARGDRSKEILQSNQPQIKYSAVAE